MKALFFIKENKDKVECLIKQDDLINRQSIIIRSADSLDINDKFKNGYFLLIDGNDEAIKKADKLLKDLSERVVNKNEERIISKIKEEEEKAIEGFGGILG